MFNCNNSIKSFGCLQDGFIWSNRLHIFFPWHPSLLGYKILSILPRGETITVYSSLVLSACGNFNFKKKTLFEPWFRLCSYPIHPNKNIVHQKNLRKPAMLYSNQFQGSVNQRWVKLAVADLVLITQSSIRSFNLVGFIDSSCIP